MYVMLVIVGLLLLAAHYDGRKNRKKQEELKVLHEKQDELREQLKNISIKQAVVLKDMVENGVITMEKYYHQMDQVYQQCVINDIDVTILGDIKPGKIITSNEIKQRLLKVAAKLNEMGDMKDIEFNNTINETLDRK